jgi:methylglutamate dehydrogenase subunit C
VRGLGVEPVTGVVRSALGGRSLRGVEIVEAGGRIRVVPCDCLAVSNGWSPSVHLTCHHNGKPVWDPAISAFVPGALPEGIQVAGTAAGRFSLTEALTDGARLGAEAARACGFNTGHSEAVPAADDEPVALSPLWHVAGGRGKAFVDLQNDVMASDIAQAAREGFSVADHMKRYTTLGMATDQGKTANLAGLALLAEQTGRSIPETGTTTFRPPFVPVAIGALAGHHRGRHFRPTRLAPTHRWSERQRAVFIESGPWLRAQYYPRAGEKDWLETINREVRAVRSAVGICDVSTLGKIELQGPDAARFLDRVYANSFASLPVGKARYGLMLREDGFVFDDGTAARLGEHRYLMTTTTANAARVMQHLDFCQQVHWPEMDLRFASVSEQWAQVAVAGPRARDVLQKLLAPDCDISDLAFPYLAAGEIRLRSGIAGRLFRLSFSGERAYELAVPAGYGETLMDALMAVGAEFGITPYGIEALGVMRIEKGHVAGNELNGQTTARDLGLGRMMARKKDYIGRLMAERPALVAEHRPSLAGFRPVEAGRRLRAGAHFIGLGREATIENDEGYMTSVAYSPMLAGWIALGLIRGGASRAGERVMAVDPLRGQAFEVEISNPVFYDPQGERLHG